MFYQVKVATWHLDNRLWFDPITNKVVQYRLTVRVIGASSSAGVANFILKHAAEMIKKEKGKNVYSN